MEKLYNLRKKWPNSLAFMMIFCLSACSGNEYLEDLYIAPKADFSLDADQYTVLQTVYFSNKGTGTNFVVWTGDAGHQCGMQGNTGFPVNSDGSYSYAYREKGDYELVWIASSINKDGEVRMDSLKKTITIIEENGGLESFTIPNIIKMTEYAGTVYYSSLGEFVNDTLIMCPIIWSAWNDKRVNTIKTLFNAQFSLTSSTASLYWYDEVNDTAIALNSGASKKNINYMKNGKLSMQQFVLKTSSGYSKSYYVAPVMIPAFTSFCIDGVQASIARNLSYYNCYNVTLSLPKEASLQSLKPEFTIMNNDSNLLDGTNCKVSISGKEQVSGTSIVDFSQGEVVYDIEYYMLGANNHNLKQTAKMYVSIQ